MTTKQPLFAGINPELERRSRCYVERNSLQILPSRERPQSSHQMPRNGNIGGTKTRNIYPMKYESEAERLNHSKKEDSKSQILV